MSKAIDNFLLIFIISWVACEFVEGLYENGKIGHHTVNLCSTELFDKTQKLITKEELDCRALKHHVADRNSLLTKFYHLKTNKVANVDLSISTIARTLHQKFYSSDMDKNADGIFRDCRKMRRLSLTNLDPCDRLNISVKYCDPRKFEENINKKVDNLIQYSFINYVPSYDILLRPDTNTPCDMD
ncbi:MAG: hypothetical protein GY909_15960 [Oligoflexia bacterium]|nr:hypothetical protein [Oligoflexia bacterium]